MDRTAFDVVDLHAPDDNAYWWSRTPEERMQAIEINRRIVYGYGDTPPRFQKVFEVVQR